MSACPGASGNLHRHSPEIECLNDGHQQGSRRCSLRPDPRGACTFARCQLPGRSQTRHGAGYEYSHNHEDGWVEQEYLPEARRYYEPVDRGYEAEIRKRMEELRKRRSEHEKS